MRKKAEIYAVLIDTELRIAFPRKIPNNLKSFYKEINCTTIDIITRFIDGEPYDIICDDEGLLKPENHGRIAIVTTYQGNPAETIVGNALIVKHDADGNCIGLSFEEMEAVLKNYNRHIGQSGGEKFHVVVATFE